ncbi:MAG: glycoside hydrolase family 5 protein [Chloroflexaceae bacterium]|nr:glycoside hydrolase family 5 protein [Chloroflexaceae bacterium]
MFHHRTLLRLISWLCLASLLVLSAPAQAQTPTDKDADDIAIYELPEDHAYVAPPQPIEYYLQDTPASATLSQSTSQLPIFGAEIKPPRFNNIVRSRAKNLGASWVRLNAISWRDVQLEADTPPEQWNWEAASLQQFEQNLTAATAAGMTPTVIVDDHPRWATVFPTACGPILQDRFDDYGRFLTELIKRYGGEPYNVKHWELGNEVDIDPDIVQPDNIYGCWGDIDDPYYAANTTAKCSRWSPRSSAPPTRMPALCLVGCCSTTRIPVSSGVASRRSSWKVCCGLVRARASILCLPLVPVVSRARSRQRPDRLALGRLGRDDRGQGALSAGRDGAVWR